MPPILDIIQLMIPYGNEQVCILMLNMRYSIRHDIDPSIKTKPFHKKVNARNIQS